MVKKVSVKKDEKGEKGPAKDQVCNVTRNAKCATVHQ